MRWSKEIDACIKKSSLWLLLGYLVHGLMSASIQKLEVSCVDAQKELVQLQEEWTVFPKLEKEIEGLVEQRERYREALPTYEDTSYVIEAMVELVGTLKGEVMELRQGDGGATSIHEGMYLYPYQLTYSATEAESISFLNKICQTPGIQVLHIECYKEDDARYYVIVEMNYYSTLAQV